MLFRWKIVLATWLTMHVCPVSFSGQEGSTRLHGRMQSLPEGRIVSLTAITAGT